MRGLFRMTKILRLFSPHEVPEPLRQFWGSDEFDELYKTADEKNEVLTKRLV